jgi:hypothetical protein
MKSLKALSLFAGEFQSEDIALLSEIKNLRHLRLVDTRDSRSRRGAREDTDERYRERARAMQSIIKNSTSTLESLVVKTDKLLTDNHLLVHWGEKGPASAMSKAAEPERAAFYTLKSLNLTTNRLETDAIAQLHRSIDFTKLDELVIGPFGSENCLLFRNLAALTDPLSSQGANMKLRHLCVSMKGEYRLDLTPEEIIARLETKCRFISSFDSLETLQLDCFGEHPKNATIGPRLTDMLLQAILRHSNLRTLRIFRSVTTSTLAIPNLSAKAVGQIVDGLPWLQEFEFMADRGQMVGI